MIRLVFSAVLACAVLVLAVGSNRTPSERASGARCQTSQVFRDSSVIWLRDDPGIGGPLESYVDAAPIGVTVSPTNDLQLLVLSGGGNSSSSEVFFARGGYESFSKLLDSKVAFRVTANNNDDLPTVSLEYSGRVCEASKASSCERWRALPQKLSVVFDCRCGSTNPLDDPFWMFEGR